MGPGKMQDRIQRMIPRGKGGFNCRAPQLPKGDCPAVPPPSHFSIWEVIPLYLLPPLPSIL
jgi:hypothetical protein